MSDEWTYSTAANQLQDLVQAPGRSPGTLAEAVALHGIEGNPLDAEDIAMFEMFEREGWSPERRRAYIIAQAGRAPFAAE